MKLDRPKFLLAQDRAGLYSIAAVSSINPWSINSPRNGAHWIVGCAHIYRAT